MRYNIIDALAGVVMVFILVPKLGVNGYLVTIILTELLNFILSVQRLIKVSNFNIHFFHDILKPVCCIFSAIAIVKYFFTFQELSFFPNLFVVFLQIILVLIGYVFYLYLSSYITHKDIQWFVSIFTNKNYI